MTDTQLTTSDIEALLINIRNRQQLIDAAAAKRDEQINYFRSLIDSAKKNFDEVAQPVRADIEILKHQLENFYQDNPPLKGKSLKFAAGSFGYNKAQTKFYLNGSELNADNQELLAFVKRDYPEFLKQKEYVDWAGFKKNLIADDPDNVIISNTGEVVAGLRAQKSFYVKTN